MEGSVPYAPMPPHGGGFEGVQMGPPLEPIPMDDFYGAQYDNVQQYNGNNNGQEQFYDFDNNRGGKQKKNKKSKNQNLSQSQSQSQNVWGQPYIETTYTGWEVEKAEPRHGQRSSWSVIESYQLMDDQNKLYDIIQQNRLKTGKSPHGQYKILGSEFKGVVDRLLNEHQREERDRNAEWKLADVKCITRGWPSTEVRKLRVIFKRHDKYQVKRRDSKRGRDLKTAQYGERIDLNEPIRSKKNSKGSKKVRQTRSVDNLDLRDDRYDGGFNDFQHQGQHQPPPPPRQHQNNFQPQLPMPDQFGGPVNIPSHPPHIPPPPPGPMPMSMQFEPHNFQQGPPPPLQRRQSALEPSFNNPFDPHPQFAVPEAIESPISPTTYRMHPPHQGQERALGV